MITKDNIYLAPMAGVTNSSFRTICKKMKCGTVCCEMVSDSGIVHMNKKTLNMCKLDKKQRPISLQIFGSDVDTFVKAAQFVEKNSKPDFIDINMGCPARKVAFGKEAGSALLKNPKLVYDIVKNVVDSVKTPVTVKIRSGWDEKNINAVEIAKLIEKAGAAKIIVHPRTRSQMFSGHSDWDIIKQVKDNVKIPVIGNGDIKNSIDAKKMIEETGCDGIMIGRAAIGNPWIFKQTYDYLFNNKIDKIPTIKEKIKMISTHMVLLKKEFGEERAVVLIRQHITEYLKGIENRKEFTNSFFKITSYKQAMKLLKNFTK